MNAPQPTIIFVGVGDNGVWRRAHPHDRRHHKAIRSIGPPRRLQPIPTGDREGLRRRVQELHRQTQAQRESLKAAGGAFRTVMRAA
jgi:hypothetical protein